MSSVTDKHPNRAGESRRTVARTAVPVGPKRGVLSAIACPSVRQCTAVSDAGQAITFNPASPRTATTARIDRSSLEGISCPNVTQCTALGRSGRETTFDPRKATHQKLDSPRGC
jgi:hypothetical protein